MEEERTPTTNELREILAKLGLPGITDEAIHAFTVEEDGGAYAVWRIDAGSGSCVLKRAKAFELETYRCFFRDKKPYAPAFYGSCAFDGAEAYDRIRESGFDLILLVVILPEVSGFELLESAGPIGTPVIFLTAMGSVGDRVKGLKLGADDYIVKPFEIAELLARVEAVLRRSGRNRDVLEARGLRVDLRSREVRRNGEILHLTKKEYDLLLLFLENPDKALYRDTIYERVWGDDSESGIRVVDLNVQRLRKKLGWEDVIRSVSRIGYLCASGEGKEP